MLLALALLCGTNVHAAQNVASPKKVVYIDPGHGGRRPGAVAGKILEKDINLKISLLVKELLGDKMPELAVYLAREADIDLHADGGVDNYSRAKQANELKADLYVSIHANALANKSMRGAEVVVLQLGGEKLEEENREKALRFVDEDEYVHISKIDKNSLGYINALARQAYNDPINRMFGGILGREFEERGHKFLGVKTNQERVLTVLFNIECPGVVVEVGYMSNEQDLKYITSEKGQQELADAIADAIVEYMSMLDRMRGSVAEDSGDVVTEESAPQANKDAMLASGYTIQLLSSTRELDINDSQFKQYRGRVMLKMGGSGNYRYKYCYGSYPSSSAASADLQEVRKSFKDAYVVRYEGGNIKSK